MKIFVKRRKKLNCPPLKGERIIKEKGKDPFKHPVVREWYQFFLRNWKSDKEIAFLLPCTSVKPYNKSPTHKIAYSIAKNLNLQFYSVSEPMLLVPREYENCYPFNSYDYPPNMMTEEEKQEFIDLLSIALQKIAEFHNRIIAVLPKHHYNIVEKAEKKASIKIELHPYGKLAFKTISDTLRSIK